jgi:hypothetical protein
LSTVRSTSKVTHNFTPSVAAWRLLHFKGSSNLNLTPVEVPPTTQEVETTSGFGHGETSKLLICLGSADEDFQN